MIHSEYSTLDIASISWWIICGTFLQRHCFFQKWKVLCQEKHLNSIIHDFICFFSVYVFVIVFLPYAFSEYCAETNGYTFLLSMFFLLKDLFCFVCLRAAKETTCIWAQSNNKTIVLLDVVFFEEMMLLHVCDIWDHTLEKGCSDILDQNKNNIAKNKIEKRRSSETKMYWKYACHIS